MDDRDKVFGAAFFRKLTGRAAGGHDRVAKRSLTERLGWLGKRHKGDEKRAAREAGVTDRTWKRWQSGQGKPSKKSLEKLARAERQAISDGLSKRERERQDSSTKKVGTRDTGGRVTGGASFSGTVRVSNDERSRTLEFGRHLPSGFMGEVRQAYVEGGEEGAMEKMREGLGKYFGTDNFEIIDVESLDFDPIQDPLDAGDGEGRYVSDVEGPKPGDFLED